MKLDVRLSDSGDQRAFRSLAGFQQARKETAVAHPRYMQLECAHAGVPAPIAVAVAFTVSIRTAMIALSTQVPGDFKS